MELVHCTVVENRAPWVGGLLVEGTMVVRNSIVSINYSKEGRKDVEDAAGGLASEGYNVFGDVAVEGTMPTDRLGGDPGLSGLWYYGGPTMTHSLAFYAPAVDHVPAHLCLDPFGNLLDQDQRGTAARGHGLRQRRLRAASRSLKRPAFCLGESPCGKVPFYQKA